MTNTRSAYQLGATLYMPVLRRDILECLSGERYPGLRSVVLCLEDALAEKDVRAGLDALRQTMLKIAEQRAPRGNRNAPLVFVRPRNLEMARRIADMPAISAIDGFVAPKVRPGDHVKWVGAIDGTALALMPTLETVEIFDAAAVSDLKDELLAVQPGRVLALRVGGNDLMNCLGVRRAPKTTLYDGPLLYVLSMLMSVMGSAGFALTAPVFETLHDRDFLRRETERDVQFGFVGKTAIHPAQIETIQTAFAVTQEDYDCALRMVDEDAPAVFQFAGAMCEPTTHRSWADRVLERARHYGLRAERPAPVYLYAPA